MDATLFVIADDKSLIGSITDGDIRRGLIQGVSMKSSISELMFKEPKFIYKNQFDNKQIKDFRDFGIKILPILDEKKRILDLINFRIKKTILPIDVIIMAGGKGKRLMPLTENTPKPLLKIGNKTIIEHLIDKLILVGIKRVYISINYLGELIKEKLGTGDSLGIEIKYIEEDNPLGTIGAVSLNNDYTYDSLMVINSDILTSIDFEDLYLYFQKEQADLTAVGIPYNIDVPYGIFELSKNEILNINEKPTYTYYSNGGIYLFKTNLKKFIPFNQPVNATEFIENLIKSKHKVISYFLLDYWLDVGSPSNLMKAQNDINTI